jgi:hypothetical protein
MPIPRKTIPSQTPILPKVEIKEEIEEIVPEKPKTPRKAREPKDDNKEVMELLKNLEARLVKLEQTPITQTQPVPDHILMLLKSVFDGELKRCKNGKWSAKYQTIKSLAAYFQLKI